MAKRHIRRSQISFNAAISGRAGEPGERAWEWSLDVLHQSQADFLLGDLITYNALISSCEKQWLMALLLLGDTERNLNVNGRKNVITFSAAISACDKASQWESALVLLQEACKSHLLNLITYSAAISACVKGKQWQQALRVYDEICKAGLQVNVIAYHAGISACEQGMQSKRVLELIAELIALQESFWSYSRAHSPPTLRV